MALVRNVLQQLTLHYVQELHNNRKEDSVTRLWKPSAGEVYLFQLSVRGQKGIYFMLLHFCAWTSILHVLKILGTLTV
jgi:hypothetical protein